MPSARCLMVQVTTGLACVAAFGFGSLRSDPAHAGAFYIPERGARALSLGGAFVAGCDDMNCQWMNPAGLIRIAAPIAFYLDVGVIFADQHFQRQDDAEVMRKDPVYANGFPDTEDIGGAFPDPSLGIASNFGLDDWVFALGLYGPYAGSNEWPEDGPQRYALVSLKALELFIQASVAWRPVKQLSVGFGFQWVVTQLKQRVDISAYTGVFGWAEERDLDAFAEVSVTDAFTPGATFGILWTPIPGFDVGVSGQLPVHVEAEGTVKVNTPTNFYFSDSSVKGDKISLELDFPPILRLGLRVYDEDLWSIELASVVEFWSVHDKVAVTPHGVTFENVPGVGTFDVKPFDLIANSLDVVSVRLGGWWRPGEGIFKIRAGAFFETGSHPDETLSVLKIDGEKFGVGVGGTATLGPFDIDLAFGYVRMFERTVTNTRNAQVNAAYLNDPQPYGDNGPSYVANGTYGSQTFILATTLAGSF